jgi:TetR/AcrR family transcriptional regulator, transcriptional repressor for nem operon
MSNTRDVLIDTAIFLFLGKGYGTVGTAEICRVAGVNKGTFYHFFSSKTDLLIAAFARGSCLSS